MPGFLGSQATLAASAVLGKLRGNIHILRDDSSDIFQMSIVQ